MKKQGAPEVLATLISVAAVVGAMVTPFVVEKEPEGSEVPAGTRIVTLTGMADAGYWTEEEVRGGNYWTQTFSPARPVLDVGQAVVLRFKSADVVHSFYSPGLGVGPIEVYPGHVTEVVVTPDQEGVFGYYCTTMCGSPHFAMKGVVIVRGEGRIAVEGDRVEPTPEYWLQPPPPPNASLAERGKWLFHQKGCATCHGAGGQGGVPNWNYVNETVPALNNLASKMFLFFPEDVEEIVSGLEEGRPLAELEETTAIPRFSAVLAQYESIRNVIRRGNPPGKADPNGPPPPLEMPAWEYLLSEEDIDATLAYLLELSISDGESP